MTAAFSTVIFEVLRPSSIKGMRPAAALRRFRLGEVGEAFGMLESYLDLC